MVEKAMIKHSNDFVVDPLLYNSTMMKKRTLCLLCGVMLLSQLGVLVIQHRHLCAISVEEDSTPPGFMHQTSAQRESFHSTRHNHYRQGQSKVRRRQRPTSGSTAASYQADTGDKRLLVHLHIGKNGGTSVDRIGPSLAHQTNRLYIPQGHMHFDWSFIDKLPQDKAIDVITMLRNPISRAASQFYYAKTLKWTRRRPIGHMNLEEYLNDTNEMMQTRTIWVDGQAATWWLTGTHIEKWVNVDPSEVEERERIYATNATAMCHLAADRLDQTMWFGILEDLPRSMELLQHALGLTEIPSLPKANANQISHEKPTQDEQEALASLMPRDLWVYEYGKRLFEARYQATKTGKFVQPTRPPIPDTWTCTSTRSRLNCNEGPFKGSHERQVPLDRFQVRQK